MVACAMRVEYLPRLGAPGRLVGADRCAAGNPMRLGAGPLVMLALGPPVIVCNVKIPCRVLQRVGGLHGLKGSCIIDIFAYALKTVFGCIVTVYPT